MTLAFWLIAWAMTLLVLGQLLWPMLKRQESSKQQEGENTLSVYRQQFAELEQDRMNSINNPNGSSNNGCLKRRGQPSPCPRYDCG